MAQDLGYLEPRVVQMWFKNAQKRPFWAIFQFLNYLIIKCLRNCYFPMQQDMYFPKLFLHMISEIDYQ